MSLLLCLVHPELGMLELKAGKCLARRGQSKAAACPQNCSLGAGHDLWGDGRGVDMGSAFS